MKLYFLGHSERYAIEQLQMQLFPDDPPEVCDEPFKGDGMISALFRGKTWVTATTRIIRGSTIIRSRAHIRTEQADVRATRRLLQRSFYSAAAQAREQLPPWGALAGVRPTKLATAALLDGQTDKEVDRMLRTEFYVTTPRRKLCIEAAHQTLSAMKNLAPRDLSVYIGIPFCPTRCAYCSFVSQSIEKFGDLLAPYLDVLLREIEYTGKKLAESGWHIRTLYMGGGTPTTLSSPQMARLLQAIQDNFDLSRCLEFTVEGGRPDTLDAEKLAVIKNGGATRISINPQTMSDSVLHTIGRRHTAQQTIDAYQMARAAGFTDINMDIIAGLPCDTLPSFTNTMQEILAMNPTNITVHTLALKKGAARSWTQAQLPGRQTVRDMLAEAAQQLRAAGFLPYYLYRQKYTTGGFENTGWCREGYPGLYNIYMMEELHTILSLGGGGMTKVQLAPGQLERFHNPKSPQDYIARADELPRQKDEIFDLLAQIKE